MLYFITLFAYVTVCFWLPNILWQHLNRKKRNADPLPVRHRLWTWIYWLYCSAVLHLTGVGTIWDLIAYGGAPGNIHWIPFSEPATIPNILNMIMMMPFGFLLPMIWKNWRRLEKVILAGFGFSLLIEVLQLFNTRLSDVDDLVMNTLGAAAGYLIWILYNRLFGRSQKATVSQAIRAEAVLYLLLGTLGVFLLYNWRPISEFMAGL